MKTYFDLTCYFNLDDHIKTYCPFCTRVKQLLAQLGANYKAVELDVESEWIDFSVTSILYSFQLGR